MEKPCCEWTRKPILLLLDLPSRKWYSFSEKNKFLFPIKPGTIAKMISNLSKVKNVTIEILIEFYLENMYSDVTQKTGEALFIFIAINEVIKLMSINKKEISILDYSE